MKLVPRVRDNDWSTLRQILQKLASSKLGPNADVKFGTIQANSAVITSLSVVSATISGLVATTAIISTLTVGSVIAADINITAPSDIYNLSHDSFTNFVIDEHIAHSGIEVTTTAPLSGGGSITATRNLSFSYTSNLSLSSGYLDVVYGTPAVTTFLGLSDTPAAFATTDMYKYVTVNTASNALEFTTALVTSAAGGGITTFLGLSDTPAAFTTTVHYVTINTTFNALEFTTALVTAAGSGSGYTSRCSAYLSAAQTIGTGSWTVVALAAENYDEKNEFNTTTHKFIPVTSGYYHVSAGVGWASPVANKTYYTAIAVNGTNQCSIRREYESTAGFRWNLSRDIALVTADYVELKVYHNVGANDQIEGYNETTFMDIHRFG